MCTHASGTLLSSLVRYWISMIAESWLNQCDMQQHHLSHSWNVFEFSRNLYIYLLWNKYSFNIYLSYCKRFLLFGTQIHYLCIMLATVNYYFCKIVICFLLYRVWFFYTFILGLFPMLDGLMCMFTMMCKSLSLLVCLKRRGWNGLTTL